MKALFCALLLVVLAPKVFAADLSSVFKSVYDQSANLSAEDQSLLKNFDIYLVPGLMSESFLSADRRSQVNLTKVTGEYLGEQKRILTEKYGLSVKLISSSSRSVAELKQNIRNALKVSRYKNRKALFLTHSLGGLGLLEELLTYPEEQDIVGGIIFLQSPFYGTAIADFYFGPYPLNEVLGPLLPFLNMSSETINYLGTKSREAFMAREKEALAGLIAKVPLFTVSGVVDDLPTLLAPAANLMGYGCLTVAFQKCLSESLMGGPYSIGDGLVPLESSILPNTDYVVLEGVDHAETVVKIPFTDYDQGRMTEVLFRILAAKMKMEAR